MAGGPLTVVVVLYGTEPTKSTALRTLAHSAGEDDQLVVLVQDNTEDVAPKGAPLEGVDEFRTAPHNPGVADAYTWAAERAEALGAEWLVLLDQDTSVTVDYLAAVRSATCRPENVADDVAVLVPRLVDGGRVLSPHGRVRLRGGTVRVGPDGIATGWVTHLSSGSVVRLGALRAIGGMPRGFPLDYLDHALAASFRRDGWRTAVMPVTLEHRLSLLDRSSVGRDRLLSVLDAEHRFHTRFGSRCDLGWLAVRQWAGAALSTSRFRPSPDPAIERAAAARTTRAVIAGHRRRSHA